MKKSLTVILCGLFMATLFSCTPESIKEEMNEPQACCDEGTIIFIPPPPPEDDIESEDDIQL
ncbi:MAG: hypothetical protein WBG46_08775 [Nonlabens sp.]